jgi:hypothetical protein
MRPIERVVRSAEEYDKSKDGKINKTDFMLWASKCAETKAILAQLAALKIDPPDPFFLSAPRAFRHLGHVGVNPETGQIEKRNIPVEWRTLFREAGITDDEIDDADTTQMLVDVVGLQVPEAISKQQVSPPASPRSNAAAPLPAPPGGWVGQASSSRPLQEEEDSRLSLSAMPQMHLGPVKSARKRRGRSRSESNKPDFQRIQELTGAELAVANQPPSEAPPRPIQEARSQPSSPRDVMSSSGPQPMRKAPPPPVPKKTQKRAPPPPPPKVPKSPPAASAPSQSVSETSISSSETSADSSTVESPTHNRDRAHSGHETSTPSITIVPPPAEDDDIPPPPPPEDDDDIPPPPPADDTEEASVSSLSLSSVEDSERPLQLHADQLDLSVVTGDRRLSVVKALRKSIYEKRTRSRGPSAATELEDSSEIDAPPPPTE